MSWPAVPHFPLGLGHKSLGGAKEKCTPYVAATVGVGG